MEWIIALIVFGLYLLLSLAFTPLQYGYIEDLKKMQEKNKEKGISQSEMYERMSFENQQLHFNTQGNPLFWGANLFATLWYNHKQKKK